MFFWKWLRKVIDRSALAETLERENDSLRSRLAAASIRATKLEERMKKIAEMAQ